MNDIAKKQNEPKQLQRLAAQRELYSSAKILHGFQIAFAVVIPITLSFISIAFSEFASYAAAYGVTISLTDALFFEQCIKNQKQKAAKIQELESVALCIDDFGS